MTRALLRRCASWAAIALLLLFGGGAGAQRAPVDPWQADMQRFAAADRAQPTAPGGIVFTGSSSIRLWSGLAGDFPGRNVLNRGFGGSTIADATRHVEQLVTPYSPHTVVLYAGDNDLAAGATPAQVRAGFDAFVRAVRARLPAVRILFVSIKPSPSRAALLPAIRQANALIRADIERGENVGYVDVFTPMLDAQGQPRAELFLDDRLHMNRAGYALWVSILAPALGE
ncbi:SGNH/GDSL hydrolase family protein [Dokdonella ginsengisoli]|uniref:SGNH/GDSL hydrolase family protein n=1 Tax=Dokdonella ginsengisoli TaxID=363846 RepID=A0ABV9QVB3_9GAMM